MNNSERAGQIALWKPQSSNEKAPQASGHFTAHRDIKAGEKISVALWRNQSDNPKAPTMTGKISDPYQKQSSGDYRAASTGSPQADDDSDLPF